MRLAPDLLYHEGRFQSGLTVVIEDGIIGAVEPGSDGQRLAGQALVPGAVNAHSHTFQRAIRGRTEYRVLGREDFWTWRERMYQAANLLTPEEIEAVARMAFVEMVQAGYTSVGEFHYVHHQRDGTPYDDPDELARRIVAAAEWAGIRLVLLRCGYARAGHGREPNPLQKRFIDPSPDFGLEAVERLGKLVPVGLAPHSLRAVPLDWFSLWAAYARERRLPLHMHVAEQPLEIEECQAEHGLRPIQLLASKGWLDERFVGVHAIHLEDDEVTALSRSFVCSCPTTERNLGDGIVRVDELMGAGTRFCLGTDSQAQIDPYEDARQLEYHLRLRDRERAILSVERLWPTIHEQGAAALGLPAGRLEPDCYADLVALDLEDSSLAGCPVDDLPAGVLFGLARTAIRQVWVGGRPVLDPEKARLAARDFAAVMGRLAG